MSNLLNKTGKKKLLDRGPQIIPTTPFKLENMDTDNKEPETTQPLSRESAIVNKVSSVRVMTYTRHMLNALVILHKAESVDELIDIMLAEYLDTHLTREEKKEFNIVMELYRKKL